MKKTIKMRAETLEQARKKFKKEIPENVFVLKTIDEFGGYQPTYDTGYLIGDSVEDLIEDAKARLPDPYFIKGEVVPEIKQGTNQYLQFNIQAENEWSAEYYIKKNWWHLTYKSHEFDEYKNTIISVELAKKGFKGVFGLGKIMDTYKVNVFVKPQVMLKYSMWSYIVAEITDDMDILNSTMIKCAKKQRIDEVKSLIEQGADINYCDKNGRNVLFYSCNDYKISKLLIDKGIDYRKADSSEDNILTYCLRYNCEVHDKLTKFLKSNGIRQNKALLKEITREAHEAE